MTLGLCDLSGQLRYRVGGALMRFAMWLNFVAQELATLMRGKKLASKLRRALFLADSIGDSVSFAAS